FLPEVDASKAYRDAHGQQSVINPGMGRVCRLFQLVQRAVGGGDQRLVAAVSGINHMEYLFQSIVGATLHAEVVNDKQRIAAKAGNILIPACKAGREV